MYYKDEFGLEINLPPLKRESPIDAIITSREVLIESLQRHNLELRKNSCKYPVVRGCNG